MPVSWTFAEDTLALGGKGDYAIDATDARRQTVTAASIIEALKTQPGIVLADEVGMGKTYVALAVVASVLLSTRRRHDPIVVMVPPGLTDKWQDEWRVFKSSCVRDPAQLAWVRDEAVRTPTEFFKLLDDPAERRARLVWMPTSCFSFDNLRDGWIKLALVRFARSQTRMDDETKKRLYKWAWSLVRLGRGLSPDRVERLLTMDPLAWKRPLVEWGFLDAASDDPVPEHLVRHANELDLEDLVKVVRGEALPGRRGGVSRHRLNEARNDFNDACQSAYQSWLDCVKWHAPLVVLDEAHHAKNDRTQLARLFRSDDVEALLEHRGESKPRLWEKFDRMLFLTATPFQLGHQELTRLLRSFAAARWQDDQAPSGTRAAFVADIDELEKRLSANRFAARTLDKLWGMIPGDRVGGATDGAVTAWWSRIEADGPTDDTERSIVAAVDACLGTKRVAERDPEHPWRALRTWVIRHNRPLMLPRREGAVDQWRRAQRVGRAIEVDGEETQGSSNGLPLAGDDALPFLLAARAQAELASAQSGARAFFAEGLCSSYEAFHHTRGQRGGARDTNDDDVEVVGVVDEVVAPVGIVPVSWYEQQIATLVPSRASSDLDRRAHPKMFAVVRRTVDLWLRGEKVLLFCFYRETAKALHEHIGKAIDAATDRVAAERLELDVDRDRDRIASVYKSIARRMSDASSPFYQTLFGEHGVLRQPFEKFPSLAPREDELLKIIAAYVRSPPFIARYFPLDEKAVRDALLDSETQAVAVRQAAQRLAHAISQRTDASDVTLLDRVAQLLAFAKELSERAGTTAVDEAFDDDDDDNGLDLLTKYLRSLAVFTSRDEDGSYRAERTVRLVYGDTKMATRRRLMLAFNSPLFPEVLVSSAVLAEGVDLHKFCRHVLHHDLCWNPSTLEQRTGRLDRIRCKAEATGRPIVVYEPFLDGSADEKMFRVVRDRERWFQIVMGQKFEFDEGTTEKLASRIPLPGGLAKRLVFDLRRYKADSAPSMALISNA